MKPKVFLSHSHADKAFVEHVANELRNTRIDVWFDEWEIPPGESFRRQIVKGIEEQNFCERMSTIVEKGCVFGSRCIF